ncbi:DUF1002 domain-containing protein [Bacillus bombysepticus]|uniref:DUF1002 domain-containing protein n=1 Tax=Bacillus bombysepticus TaxID=658666 RepID=UPI0030176630
MKKLLVPAILAGTLLFGGSHSYADSLVGESFVTIGDANSNSDREWVLKRFNATSVDPKSIINVNIKDEKKYLEHYIPRAQIGSRSISAAKLTTLDANKGLVVKVDKEKITYVTDNMITNALINLGVTDAEVEITSPIKVSGTGALTGVMKIYEKKSGKDIPEEVKIATTGEMIQTGKMADAIQAQNDIPKAEAKEDAAKLTAAVKSSLGDLPAEKRPQTEEEMRVFIEKVADNINVNIGDINTNVVNNFAAPFVDMVKLDEKGLFNMDKLTEGVKNAVENHSFNFDTQGAKDSFTQAVQEGKNMWNSKEMEGIKESGQSWISRAFSWVGDLFSSIGNLIKP